MPPKVCKRSHSLMGYVYPSPNITYLSDVLGVPETAQIFLF